ncbi:hypothetical protein VTI74DRAFT_10730 [Chaetomium olivicolor]
MESVFRARAFNSNGLVASLSPITKSAAPSGNGFLEAQGTSTKETSKKSSLLMTYASRTAASQPVANPPISTPRPLPVWGTRDKSIVLVNADGHRIDMPLPPKSAAAFENFNRKTYRDGKRYCNMYHLYGSCSGSCGYLHEQLTAAERLVMRHRLRGEKCLDRGKCRDPLCFYGHHCACSTLGKKCSFPAVTHGVDVTSWREVDTALAV